MKISTIPYKTILSLSQRRIRSRFPMRYSAILFGIISIQSSCILAHKKNPIPGKKGVNFNPHGVPVAVVLAAIKSQVDDANRDIAALKRANPSSAISNLSLQKGTCVLTATVKNETDNSGSISSVIPFSEYSHNPNNNALATTTGPSVGGQLNAASTRLVTFNFGLDPGSAKAENSAKEIVPPGGTIEETVRYSIVDHFRQILEASKKDPSASGSSLKPRSIDMKFTFVALKKASGGWQVNFVPYRGTKAPGTATPSISAYQTETQTHELSMNIPFDVPDSGDKREMIYAVDSDRRMFIKQPFNKATYDSILAKQLAVTGNSIIIEEVPRNNPFNFDPDAPPQQRMRKVESKNDKIIEIEDGPDSF